MITLICIIHLSTYWALLLKLIGAKPGGAEIAFCDPVYIASIPQLSAQTATPPSEATASTTSKQSYLKQSQ